MDVVSGGHLSDWMFLGRRITIWGIQDCSVE